MCKLHKLNNDYEFRTLSRSQFHENLRKVKYLTKKKNVFL